MSIGLLFDRAVTIQPMSVLGTDEYNNQTRAPGAPVPNVPARRKRAGVDEENVDRSLQRVEFVYFLPPDVVLTGRDRIVDGDDTFEVFGTPDLIGRRHRPHHLEAAVYRVEG